MNWTEDLELATLLRVQAGHSAAADLIVRQYDRAIHAAARDVALADPDDSYGVAALAFVEAMHSFQIERSWISFGTYVHRMMRHALRDARAAESMVTVPTRTVALYRSIMRDAQGDFDVALAHTKLGGVGMSASAFLATHHAVAVPYDVADVAAVTDTRQRVPDLYSVRDLQVLPTDARVVVDREWMDQLFRCVTPTEERILRLRFDFADVGTQTERLNRDIAPGTNMAFSDIGAVVVMSPRRVRTLYDRALDKMRAYIRTDLAKELS